MKSTYFFTSLAIAVAALAGAQQALAGPSGFLPDGVPAADFFGADFDLDDKDRGVEYFRGLAAGGPLGHRIDVHRGGIWDL